MILLNIFLLIIFYYLAICIVYNLFFSIAGRFRKPPRYGMVSEKNHFVLLIPTYKEDHIIIRTVESALDQNYPKDKFDIVVIADQLKKETIIELGKLPINLITVSFKKSTKAKSLKHALQQLPESKYDIAMILDADNLMGEGCLEKTNHAFSKGFQMVQLHRTAKNKNTATAILDSISEEIGNHILRKGHRAVNLSASLIGSGMAFNYDIFRSVMITLDIENNPAEDREINAEMLRKGLVCEYIEDAYVYDEKVQSNQVLERQRVRWISAQLHYAKQFWVHNPFKTITTNINYFDYGLQTLIMPRSMLIALSFLMVVLSLSLHWGLGYNLIPGILGWIILFSGCFLAIALSIDKNISTKEVKQAIYHFPNTFWFFLRALVRSTPKQQDFIHTPKEFIK